ncbi:MAG: glycosyl hydrolase, family 30 [Haloplasmataceae bacterium]|jgi:glucosylceramidase|nr:glycosyl hydrolase, family 30 [Haloplasmataceae bacterium]
MKKICIMFVVLTLITIITACQTTITTTTNTTENTTTNSTATTNVTTVVTTDYVVTDPREFLVSVYTTYSNDRQSKFLEKMNDLIIKQNFEDYASTTLTLDDSVLYQEIDGFGAALSESSAYLINNLDETTREQVIKELFSIDEGIGMNFVRLPMGASDFALNNYSYNDITSGIEDLSLSQFSIDRDRENVIPVLKAAFALNSHIKLMGSPWSAPAWMKFSNRLNGGSFNSKYTEVFSDYFIKFIEAYESENLPIYAITPQNEPMHEINTYPTMKMDVNQQINFIKALGPKLEAKNLDTKIIAYDHNWSNTTYPKNILLNADANNYIAGTGFHCYGGDVEAQTEVYNVDPTKGIWFTECSGGGWQGGGFSEHLNFFMKNLFIGSVNNYSKGILLWNIALDEFNGPTNGGCPNCRGVITVNSNGTYTKNVEYYAIGHLSKFVVPGAHRIEANITGNGVIITTAFLNPNGDIVVVLHNQGGISKKINLVYDGLNTLYTVPSYGVTTLVIKKG